MSVEAGIFNLLSTSSAISSLCGTRIYPGDFPTGPTYPLMVYHGVVSPQSPTMSGNGMQHWRVQFDCFAEKAMDAASLRQALLQTVTPVMQVTLSDGTLLQSATIHALNNDFMTASRVHRYTADLTFDFNFQF